MKSFTGLNVAPDGWCCNGHDFGKLSESDGFSDSSFKGCDYRLDSSHYDLAVNITISGRKSHDISGSDGSPWYKTRVKIEYVGDGSPSVFDRGFMYSDHPLI